MKNIIYLALVLTILPQLHISQATKLCSKTTFMDRNIYYGHLTKYRFFWTLFLNDKQGADTPLLIYFRGELGLGSVIRAYSSFGPFIVDKDGEVVPNPNSLTKNYHLLTIDFPCGAGFRTTQSPINCPTKQITLKDTVQMYVEALQEFFGEKNKNCNLSSLDQLDIYLWTEGFGANYILKTADIIDEIRADPKTADSIPPLKGIILGDPIISFTYQYNNFGSYALARGLIDQISLQKISTIEASLTLQDKNNKVITDAHSVLYTSIKPACPIDITKECPEIYNNLGESQIFLKIGLELKLSNPFSLFLKNNFNILRYFDQTKEFFSLYDIIPTENTAALLSKCVNQRKVLVYQTQNNFISNSISTMIFVDYLKWKKFAEFLAANSIINKYPVDAKNPQGKQRTTTTKQFRNLWKVQLFEAGADVMDHIPGFMMDKIFKPFTDSNDFEDYLKTDKPAEKSG